MSSLSIIIIVKNEADRLLKVLPVLEKFADEIIILDSGSTDNTVEIAKKYTDKVFVNCNWQGFGKQRQLAQSYASGEWILMLDADEIPSQELIEEIKTKITENNQAFVYEMPCLPKIFGKFIRHGGWYPGYVKRLYPRTKARFNNALVHEKLEIAPDMQVKKLKNDLLHYTYRDLKHYLEKSAGYADAWAKQKFAQGKESSILQAIGHALWYLLRMYILFSGWQAWLTAGVIIGSFGVYQIFCLVGHAAEKKVFLITLKTSDISISDILSELPGGEKPSCLLLSFRVCQRLAVAEGRLG